MAKAVAIVREFSKGYRFVSLRYSYPHQTHNYGSDAEAAGYLATRYLLSQGRHFIGLLEPEIFVSQQSKV